jgi:hypothetical protein
MKKKYTFFLLFFFVSSCANNDLKSRTVEDYYTPTGVDKYFLTDLPAWANFDQAGECFRKSNIRYLNLDALMKSYSLKFDQTLQLQAFFNEELSFFKKLDKLQTPTVKQEELLFYKSSEKVSSKILFFDPPTFEKINLIWFDEVIGDEKKERKLKNFLNSETMDSGVPVLVSLCLTKEEVEKSFPDQNLKMITAELFSAYDKSGSTIPGIRFDLGQFFTPEQKLYFYSQKKSVPHESVKGTFKILNY